MIGLAWLTSTTWFIPVLGWHHLAFGGVRQIEVCVEGHWDFFYSAVNQLYDPGWECPENIAIFTYKQ